VKIVLILGAVALIVLGVVLVALIVTRSRTAREDRRERQRHQVFLNELHRQALAAADVEPWARVVADQILNHLNDRKAVHR
jgi:Flp pilus assembly protein TadB